MIPQDLLTAKGTIDALLALTQIDSDGPYDVAMFSSVMDVSKGTARDRLNDLIAHDLAAEEAAMVNDSPARVYTSTDAGTEVAAALEEVLADHAVSADAHDPGGDE